MVYFEIEKLVGVWCEVMVPVSIATSLSSYVDLYCPGMSRNVQEKSQIFVNSELLDSYVALP